MFPRAQRICKTEDIITVLRQGRRRTVGVVTCSFLAKTANLSRVTVIVDTKVAKRANQRNLLKRRIRMILRSSSLPSGDLIVRLGKGAPELAFFQLKEKLEQCLKLPR